MKEFLIEYGMRDGVLIKDVVLAETIEQAKQEADRQAEDLWESNKIATAKPYGVKQETTKCTGTAQNLSPPSS